MTNTARSIPNGRKTTHDRPPPCSLNILVIIKAFGPTEYRGISQIATDQVESLAARGHNLTVLALQGGSESLIYAGATVYYLDMPDYKISSWELDPLLWAHPIWRFLNTVVFKDKFDVVHTHDLVSSIPASFVASSGAIPLVTQFHICFRRRADFGEIHFNLELSHFFQYLLAKEATRVITDSTDEQEWSARYLDCHEKITRIHPWINPRNFSVTIELRAQVRSRLCLEGCFVVLWGGRVGDYMKGPDVVGRAFSKIAQVLDSARFILSILKSDPPENTAYFFREISEKARARCTIIFPDKKSELIELYSAADVFVMGSRYEPFGLMACEAMACEKPVIMTTACGCSELAEDYVHCVKIPFSDIDETSTRIANAVIRLAHDRELAYRLGKRGRDLIECHNSNQVLELEQVYYEAISTLDPKNGQVHRSHCSM